MKLGDVISYLEMSVEEGCSLQRGMNFKLGESYSIILMSLRPNAPYADRIEDDGKILIYEGHDIPKTKDIDYPKLNNQVLTNPTGSITQNGKFFNAAQEYKSKKINPELVKVYEKIKSGIWVFNGFYNLVDSWSENSNNRIVFKFKLELRDDIDKSTSKSREKNRSELVHNRIIPTSVKLEVWKRDKGKCVDCGSNDNLHFDHILPYSKGGTSLKSENIQLLCARHNLSKSNKIQ